MIQASYVRLLLLFILSSAINAKCSSCKNSKKQDGPSDIQVAVTLSKDIFYIEDGHTKITLTIKADKQLASALNYTFVAWSVQDDLGKLVNKSGDPILPGLMLQAGDNELYYQPIAGSEGKHIVELIVSDEEEKIQKKKQIEITVQDHRPIHFQVQVQSDKSKIFAHEHAKLIVDISSPEEKARELTYTIKSISSNKEGTAFSTAETNPIAAAHPLKYGMNTLYYHVDKQIGTHTIKLVVANEKGDISSATITLPIIDVDFQVAMTPEEPTVFAHEQAKLIIHITSPQEEAGELTYRIKSIRSNKEGTSFATPEIDNIAADYPLKYGINTLYCNPNRQTGKHDIRLVVTSSNGTSKIVTASFEVINTEFQVQLKPEQPSVFLHQQAKLIINISSPQEEATKLTYKIKSISSTVESTRFTSPEGDELAAGYALKYGKNILTYDPDKQIGIHPIKLVVINSKGDTKTTTATLQVVDVDFQVQLKPEKPTLFLHQPGKFTIDISSSQKEASKLNYTIKSISSNIAGTSFSTPEVDEVLAGYALNYGKNTLSYDGNRQVGIHHIKVVVANSNGASKTVTTSLELIHTDFQVQLKLEKPTIFSHQQEANLIVDISSPPAGRELTYQIKELNGNKEGVTFSTPEGNDMLTDPVLQVGKNILSYHPNKQTGVHDIKLVVTSSHGTSRTATATLEVVDVDFQVQLKPEKPTVFLHHQPRFIVDISSSQKEATKLTYQIKEIGSNREGAFFAAPTGDEILAGYGLNWGKNTLCYHPAKQMGTHDIQLIVINSNDHAKLVTASINIIDADFFSQAKLEEVTRRGEKLLELSIGVGSNELAKEAKWQLASWNLAGGTVGKLQDVAGQELKASNVALQSAENRFKLVLANKPELTHLPQLTVIVKQPDGLEKPFVFDLSNYILANLINDIKTVEAEMISASKKFIMGEKFAEEKFNRATGQLRIIKNNLGILVESDSINKNQLEDALVKVDAIFRYSETLAIDKAIYNKFGRGINEKDSYGRTPLIEAIDKNNQTELDLVLTHPHVDLQATHTIISKNNNAAYPALSYAMIRRGNELTVPRKLLQAGANVEERALVSREALPMPGGGIKRDLIKDKDDSALLSRHINGWKTVGDHNKEVREFNKKVDEFTVVKSEWSPRHMLSNQDYKGETALHIAVEEQLLEQVKLVLAEGADINAKNGYWQTPLHMAIHAVKSHNDTKVVEIVRYLIEQGADLNAVDLNDNTPLHYAFSIDDRGLVHKDLIKLLLEKGADPTLKNRLYGRNKFGRQIDTEGADPVILAIIKHQSDDYYIKTFLQEELIGTLCAKQPSENCIEKDKWPAYMYDMMKLNAANPFDKSTPTCLVM